MEYDKEGASRANYLLPYINLAERYAKILIDIQANLRNVGKEAEAVIDWKLEEKKAEAYFDRVKAVAELSFESQKSLVWATAASKEDAEKRIFDLENTYSLRKIANAQEEHDKTLALKEAEWKKEEDRIRATAPVDSEDVTKRAAQQANLDAKLKKLNEERNTGAIEAEKKLTEAIQTELKSREDAYQKAQEKQIDLQRQLRDATDETKKALTDLAAAGATEWEKLGLKFQEATNLLKKATDELPNSPEKAVEIAKQAQSAFVALKQDIAALEKNLRGTEEHFGNLWTQVRQATMTPIQKRQDEMAEIDRLMSRAQALQQAGLLEEAGAAFKEAGGKAAGLAHPIEGQSKYQAQQEAAYYLQGAQQGATGIDQQKLAQGRVENQAAGQGIQQAGDIISQGLGAQLQTNSDKLGALTQAIMLLYQQLGGTKTFTPSQAAQEKAGINGTVGGTTGIEGSSAIGLGLSAEQTAPGSYGVPAGVVGGTATGAATAGYGAGEMASSESLDNYLKRLLTSLRRHTMSLAHL
ncbi:MAG: hypothetical protein ACLP5H_31085 [Desulfomonilaceae bacterium]